MARVVRSSTRRFRGRRAPKVLGSQSIIHFEVDGLEDLIRYLEQLGPRAGSVLLEATMDGGRVLADEANNLAPGEHVIVTPEEVRPNGVTVAVGPDREHWYYLYAETGTQPHEIVPRAAAALLFPGGGGPSGSGGQYAENVDHPGAPAQPFLRPAVDQAGGKAVDAVGERIRVEIESGSPG